MKPDKISISLGFLIIFATISWIGSCTHQPDPNSFDPVCYKDVQTIISGCYRASTPQNPQTCHDGNGEGPNYKNVDIGINQSVQAGNADASSLYTAITTVRGEGKMPPDQFPLPQESRATIRMWIEQGAHTDVCPGDTAILSKDNNELLN
jgi:hypothetical protein